MSYPSGQGQHAGEAHAEPRTEIICHRLQGIIESLTGTQHSLNKIADRLLGSAPTPIRDPGGNMLKQGGTATMSQIEDLVSQLDRLGIEIADQSRRLQSV